MKLKSGILLFCIFGFYWTLGQTKQVTITADISNYTGDLPASSHPIWGGNDTIVPLTVNFEIPKIMGAEYITFPFRTEGDSTSPNNDAVRSTGRKIWRTKAVINNQIYTWRFNIDKPCIIRNTSLLEGDYLILPGDSITITYNHEKPTFAGNGSNRFQIAYGMKKNSESILYPPGEKTPKNLSRYLELHHYLNKRLTKAFQTLDSSKFKITQYEYDWLKANFLGDTEYFRWLYFQSSFISILKNPDSLSNMHLTLSKIWDSTMYQPDATWYRSAEVQNFPGISSRGYMESFIITELNRKFNFIGSDSINNQQTFKKIIYEKIKSNYTGLFRERFLCYFISEEIIQEMGSHGWFAQSILQDYYKTPGFPSYKKWITEMEKTHQYLSLGENGGTPLFVLKDQKGNNYHLKNTSGKFTIINFWYTGCEPCKQAAQDILSLQQRYATDTNIVFLHVSLDTNKVTWKNSIKKGIYVPKKGVHVNTGEVGKKHEILKDFHVTSYPTIRMYDYYGRIVLQESVPFATTFSVEHLNTLTDHQLSRFIDGPYVFFENNETRAYRINGKTAETVHPSPTLTVFTDYINKTFTFPRQKQLSVPPTVYPATYRMLVLSDIEGNFTSLRKLLQANKVIDEEFNWIFGQGHLVFAGDMFDRGEQVTECLWLIYSLEEKAKKAGGIVHFILGNHEIMNLQGNHRYSEEKYKTNAILLNKTLTELYNENSELGRWLRTKNIVEKIGDMLFLHGGVSSELNQQSLSLESINTLARPFFDTQKKDYGDRRINTIMSSTEGPFWFRGYYNGKPAQSLLDSTLKKFKINHIVTGHTIVADTISLHYDGKLINTDTRHARGKSEALLVEGDSFYRVSSKGNKILLFKRRSQLSNKAFSHAD